MNNTPFVESKYFTPVLIALLLLAEILLIACFHRNMMMLEDRLAQETSVQEQLIEDQKKLKVETAALRSPQRIELIAKNRLQMHYPKNNEVHLITK